ETLYLPQQLSSGVTILPYRTAAQVPFEYHIVIGASQDNLSAVFGSLTFLLDDKRKKLGIEDTDASEAFIKLHTLNSRNQAVFFCAEETFSGYAIPHSFLDAPGAPVKRYGELDEYKILFSEDHFLKEQELYSDLQAGKKISDSSQIFYRQQIDGFNAWRKRRSHAESPEGGPDSLIMELIKNRYCRSKTMPGKLSVSASALKPYYQCALQWLFREILALEKVRMETTLMADNVVGSLYHAALDHFFKKAKEKNGGMILPPENGLLPDEYAALVTESVDAALSQFSTGNEQFKISALTARLIRAEKQSIFDQLVIFLTAILSYFAGYYIADTELKLSHAPLEKPYFLTGIVDCVLEDRSDVSNPKSVILDFKLYGTPNHGLCTGDGDNGLEDFQLPMYVRLTEENGYKTVSTALFFSILKAEPNVIFGVISSNGKEKPYFKKDRIERTGEADNKFDAVMAEFNEKTERYAKEVLAGAFSTISDDEEKCFACDYHAVCRTTYAVNRRSHG
ncbi:MAG: PD-(D/E)XK nuclease family protein, partial [Treponema sp.]|nr:PD-(D/E)XK nuclease family protein [Treponema sp.]